MNIQSLTALERILQTEELWDSVRAEADGIALTSEQITLLDSRLSALETDGDAGDTWEGVKARIGKAL